MASRTTYPIDTVYEVNEESGKVSDRISSMMVSSEDFNEFGAAILKKKAETASMMNAFRKVVDKEGSDGP
jgi:hypothetical protein